MAEIQELAADIVERVNDVFTMATALRELTTGHEDSPFVLKGLNNELNMITTLLGLLQGLVKPGRALKGLGERVVKDLSAPLKGLEHSCDVLTTKLDPILSGQNDEQTSTRARIEALFQDREMDANSTLIGSYRKTLCVATGAWIFYGDPYCTSCVIKLRPTWFAALHGITGQIMGIDTATNHLDLRESITERLDGEDDMNELLKQSPTVAKLKLLKEHKQVLIDCLILIVNALDGVGAELREKTTEETSTGRAKMMIKATGNGSTLAFG